MLSTANEAVGRTRKRSDRFRVFYKSLGRKNGRGVAAIECIM